MNRYQLERIFGYLGPVGLMMLASKEQLMQVNGVGEKVADAIIAHFSIDENRDAVIRMAAAGVNMHTPASVVEAIKMVGDE